MKYITHNADLCVVGGGFSGICAAIAAARNGVKVLLMHDRPVFGGNASGEIRMWVCGAHGDNNKETGILEEIQLENMYRNPDGNYSIWDSILYEKVMQEDNITALMNCSCLDAVTADGKIRSIKGWQLTTEIWHTVHADYFADCSGDGVLAVLSGAKFRVGREARAEYNESIAPLKADNKTMGMSCLFQIRETDRPQKFIPPSWANKYAGEEELDLRNHNALTNFWWIELGGEDDSIHDTEKLKHELLKIVFGVWDHMKNHGDHGVENWVIEWIGFLPGKRESRRYIGDYVLTQNDVEAEGRFDDIVAYGGWSMDDHFPAGFNHRGSYPTIFHHAPSPYGIPYRCLYSANIGNLFCAGRNISATHAAMSSTRVMATCALMGQAVGTAASIAVRKKNSPREVYLNDIEELKNTLMQDDLYLPFNRHKVSNVMLNAKIITSNGDGSVLINGYDRTIGEDINGLLCCEGDSIQFDFGQSEPITEIRIFFDSDLNDKKKMPCSYPLNAKKITPPSTLVKQFEVILYDKNGGVIDTVKEDNNYQRLYVLKINKSICGFKLVLKRSWGGGQFKLFSVYAN